MHPACAQAFADATAAASPATATCTRVRRGHSAENMERRVICSQVLTPEAVAAFKEAIDNMYYFQLLIGASCPGSLCASPREGHGH